MNRTWRILLIILLVIIGIGAGVYYYNSRQAASQAPQYQIVTVQRGTVVSKVTTTGTISPNRQVALTFKSAGTVAEVLVQPGDRVTEGQLLARLDDRDYQLAVEQAESALEISKLQLAKAEAGPSPEDIAAARASVESAEASLNKLKQGPTPQEITVAKSSLEQARIALQQAQAAYDKVAWVGGVGALPQSLQLQQATIQYEAALANYQLATQGATESQIKAAEAQVAQAKANLQRLLKSPSEEDLAIAREQVHQAEINLEKARNALEGARLVAPFAGIVAQVNIRELESVPMGQPAIVLIDDSTFYINVNVDELDIPLVAVGQQARVTLDALPGVELAGHVDYIAPVATSVGGITSYQVKVIIDQADPRVRVGMTANVDIITERREDVLVIVNRALQYDRQANQFFVEKLVNGSPTRVAVKLGLRGDQESEVLEGLSEGDQVAIRVVSTLQQLQSTFGSSGFGGR